MSFLDTLKEVSAHTVRKEAARLFVLAIAGDKDSVDAVCAQLLDGASPEERQVAATYLFCASPPYSEADEKRLRHADLLVSLPGGPGLTDFRPADTLQVARPEDLVGHVLEHRPDLWVPLGRRLPGFRQQAAESVIRGVSRVNAEFAAIAGIPTVLPVLGPVLGVVAGADVLILTKNQVLMIFRLAAIYGEDLGLRDRYREVLTVIGGAFGWRTLARHVLGLVPGGVGLGIRALIAYSGTYATGRVAQMLFDEGRRPDRREMRRIYEDAAALAKGTLDTLRPKRELPEERKALPEGSLPDLSDQETSDSESSTAPTAPSGKTDM